MTQEQRTLHTRQQLADTLKQKMQHKPFSKITVSELIRDCGLNRKTFYYHFEDVYALLIWTLQQEALEVIERMNLIQEHEQAIVFVLDYIEQNETMLLNIYHSIGRDVLRQFFYDDFIGIAKQLVEQTTQLLGVTVSEEYKLFLSGFCADAVAGAIFSALTNPALRQRDTMISYITATLKSTLVGSLREMDGRG